MPLAAGTQIGGYEIVALLGAGGMGEVYRARDKRLARQVAIKVLASHIAGDGDALLRFEREARALAALNHPNIAAIYDVQDGAGQPWLVLELVEGETLAARVVRGAVPVGEAIEYAKQIADALDTAHEAGIVHRDLKPANIKITDAGQVKVLDFGLAKALAAAAGEPADFDAANSPTITVHGTQQGVILGTAAYMSPEQARGKRVDKRADIWAFGCVLYEMLTRQRAFAGETTSDVIAAIIERTPDLTRLPAATPPHLRRIIQRCLEKDPTRRARDIADVRAELDHRETAHPVPSSWARPFIAMLAVVTIAAIAAAIALWLQRPDPAPRASAIEFTFPAPPGHSFPAQHAAPSPDGQQVAFIARDQGRITSLWLQSLATATARRVEGTEGVSNVPKWSPDGRALAFFVAGTWKRVNIDGGPPVTIVSGVGANLGASWGVGDHFLLAPANRTSLVRVPATGGSLTQVTTLDTEKENSHRWPQLLPDGRHFLFTARSDSPERLGIKVGSLDSGEVRTLINVASSGVYTEPGWLLYVTPDEVLMARRLDSSTWMLQGSPQPLAGPVRYNGPSFSALFDASLDGRVLTYVPAPRSKATLEWFDRNGASLGRVGPERDYRGVQLSRDARIIAVELPDAQLGTRDIWFADSSTHALTRFTSHSATDWRPVFSPDGRSLAFASDRAGVSTIFRAPTDGAHGEAVLYRHPSGGVFPFDWSRDGKRVFATADDQRGRPSEVLAIPVDGGSPVIILAQAAGGVMMPRVSPDGDRIAFASRIADDTDIYMVSIADGRRVRVSAAGGTNPAWGRGGRELFFKNTRNEIMRVAVDGMTLGGPPEKLFQPCASINRSFSAGAPEQAYGVNPDGTRFLAICDPLDVTPSAMHVVVNWQSRLR